MYTNFMPLQARFWDVCVFFMFATADGKGSSLNLVLELTQDFIWLWNQICYCAEGRGCSNSKWCVKHDCAEGDDTGAEVAAGEFSLAVGKEGKLLKMGYFVLFSYRKEI